MTVFAVCSPLIATHDPNALSLANAYLPPGTDGHLFGTDELGRDLFSRIVYGARISMAVAWGGTLMGGVLGSILGMIAGYNGKWADSIIMRIMDGMFAFPFILLAIFLMTIFGFRPFQRDYGNRNCGCSQICPYCPGPGGDSEK